MPQMSAEYMRGYMRTTRDLPIVIATRRRRRRLRQQLRVKGLFLPLAEFEDARGETVLDSCVFCGLLSKTIICPFCRREIES